MGVRTSSRLLAGGPFGRRPRLALRSAFAVAGLALTLGCSGVHWLDRDPELSIQTTEYTKVVFTVPAQPDGDVVPSEGSYFLVLSASVTDRSAHESYGVAYEDFAVETASGASFPAVEVSAEIISGCTGAQVLEKGDSLACYVVFEVPEDDPVAVLAFSTPNGGEAQADVEPPTCTWCDSDCVDLASGEACPGGGKARAAHAETGDAASDTAAAMVGGDEAP